MSGAQTNLIGAIVEVSRVVTKWEQNDVGGSVAVDYRTLANRGQIRAVTATSNGALVVWIEELDAAESACWFGEDAPKVEWQNGDYHYDACLQSTPGLLRESVISAGEYERMELLLIARQRQALG